MPKEWLTLLLPRWTLWNQACTCGITALPVLKLQRFRGRSISESTAVIWQLSTLFIAEKAVHRVLNYKWKVCMKRKSVVGKSELAGGIIADLIVKKGWFKNLGDLHSALRLLSPHTDILGEGPATVVLHISSLSLARDNWSIYSTFFHLLITWCYCCARWVS